MLRRTAALAVVALALPAWGADATQALPPAEPSANVILPSATGSPTEVVEKLWPKLDFSSHMEEQKSYGIPAIEILTFQGLLNLRNRYAEPGDDYDVTIGSIRRNLQHAWVTDNDPFQVNQFLHPYQGSIYHGAARSAGLNYWQSLGYTFAASAVWEIAGEQTPPSRNDQIASGIGGSFFGETLFRLANLVLDRQDIPPVWREVGATLISPPTGFNRLAFGERFRTVWPSHDPVYYSRMQVGASATTQSLPGTSTREKNNELIADFAIDYGLPGKPGYTYDRPFDYFSFEFNLSSANGFESILNRGTLVARDYGIGDSVRGVWGVYGSYDYIAPQVFRISTTALSVGTTVQWWASPIVAVQGTALLGTGYSAVGTMRGAQDEHDYHYGITPQALLATRLIFGDVASLDLSGREYFVSRAAAADTGGHDNIVRAEAALTWRVKGPHAVSVRYLWSRRDATYPDLGDRTQSRATVGIFYTLLGHDRFGAVDWRPVRAEK